jgi:hypothetical protein
MTNLLNLSPRYCPAGLKFNANLELMPDKTKNIGMIH